MLIPVKPGSVLRYFVYNATGFYATLKTRIKEGGGVGPDPGVKVPLPRESDQRIGVSDLSVIFFSLLHGINYDLALLFSYKSLI